MMGVFKSIMVNGNALEYNVYTMIEHREAVLQVVQGCRLLAGGTYCLPASS